MALITTIEAPTIGDSKVAFVTATNTDDTSTIATVMGTSQVMLCLDNAVYKDLTELHNCLDRIKEAVIELGKYAQKHAEA